MTYLTEGQKWQAEADAAEAVRQEQRQKAAYLAHCFPNGNGYSVLSYAPDMSTQEYVEFSEAVTKAKIENLNPDHTRRQPPPPAQPAAPQGFTPNRGQGQSGIAGSLVPPNAPDPGSVGGRRMMAAQLLAGKRGDSETRYLVT